MAKIIIGAILIVWGVGALFGISLMKFLFAFILIAIGLRIILGKNHDSWGFKSTKSITNEDYINEVNIFSSANKVIKSESFKGGKIVMLFSGGKIDLSQVTTKEKNINMEIVVLFGGGQLIIPKDWKVNSEGTSIFGNYETNISGENAETTIILKGVAIFGEIKIMN